MIILNFLTFNQINHTQPLGHTLRDLSRKQPSNLKYTNNEIEVINYNYFQFTKLFLKKTYFQLFYIISSGLNGKKEHFSVYRLHLYV